MAEQSERVCRRCWRPVVLFAEQYDTFERMHYVCFHYEFEHDADADAVYPGVPLACCRPSRRLVELRRRSLMLLQHFGRPTTTRPRQSNAKDPAFCV